jgi:hypothetical protein
MRKLTMSLAVSAIVASGAFATSLEDAFAKGKVSGEIGGYITSSSNGGATPDTAYSLGSVALNYETASLNGFKASLGFMASTKIDSKNNGYDSSNPSSGANPVAKSIMNVANVSYASDAFTVIAGKQAIDLEWIADYHEAVVGVVSAIPNTTIILGHTERINASANDGALEEFSVSGTEKGANVLDVTYEIDKTTKVGAYYMDAPNVFSAVGAKVEAEVSGLGVVGKYAKTSEDAAGTKDGSIMALDLSYKVEEIALNGGYISTDKDGGIGSISALGDNINPLDSGNQVYTTDAKTLYVGASTTVAGFELGGIYGTTDYKYDDNGVTKKGDESELNLTASWECKFVKNLKINALYANISGETSAADSSYYSLQAVYSF